MGDAGVRQNAAVRRLGTWLVAAGLVIVTASVVLLLWPLDNSGIRGNALFPDYRDWGWFTYHPMPQHPTPEDFRRAGITLPQDYVAQRRRTAAVIAALGVATLTTGLLLRRRPPAKPQSQ